MKSHLVSVVTIVDLNHDSGAFVCHDITTSVYKSQESGILLACDYPSLVVSSQVQLSESLITL